MKIQKIILLASVFLLQSCLLKSLRPFYIDDAIVFKEDLIGEWKDENKDQWKIVSFKELYESERKNQKLSKEDIKLFEQYKQSYFINYISKEKESYFVATTFKVGDHILIDFTPYYYEESKGNQLIAKHLIQTHSVAKFEKLENGTIKINWINDNTVEELLKDGKIRIKYDNVGVEKELLLTANSEELYKFLVKYCNSTIKDKWDDTENFTLSPIVE